jgi:hypothetical protein
MGSGVRIEAPRFRAVFEEIAIGFGFAHGSRMSVFRVLRRARLLHFAAIGGAIFFLARREDDPRAIEIPSTTLTELHAAQAQHLDVTAISAEAAHEVDAREIEDEVLYREALRLGLDKDDPIVRQRLVQKLLLIVEDLGGASKPPTDAELRAHFEKSRDRWRKPPAYRFVHVFSATRANLPSASVLEGAIDPPPAGDPFPYSRSVTQSKKAIASSFGDVFADAVEHLPVGQPSDPIVSRFGWHRVRVAQRIEGGPATFDEVRSDVELDYLLVRRERITGEYLSKTIAKYRVTIDGKKIEGFVPTRRVAARPDDSAED